MEQSHPSWDEYEKVSELGSGSFGTVYKVKNKRYFIFVATNSI